MGGLREAFPMNTKAKRWSGIALLSAVIVAGGLVLGCRSLPKDDLAEALAALPKNRPMPAPERVGPEPGLVHTHVPAADPAPERLPVVLVHGTPSTLYAWTELMLGGDGFSGLAETRDVYAIEVVGHGIAPETDAEIDFDACAADVVRALETLGLDRAHVVGSSYGGEFVWRAALDGPERIASLALLDSSGYERREQDWLSEEVVMRENSLAKIGWMLNSRDRIRSALEPHFDEIPPDRVEEFFLVCENASNWAAMIDLARDENGTRQDEISRIEAPALVLWGSRDLAYPPEVYAEAFARDLANSELVVLDDTGHYPHEERPRETIAALEAFFARVELQR